MAFALYVMASQEAVRARAGFHRELKESWDAAEEAERGLSGSVTAEAGCQ